MRGECPVRDHTWVANDPVLANLEERPETGQCARYGGRRWPFKRPSGALASVQGLTGE